MLAALVVIVTSAFIAEPQKTTRAEDTEVLYWFVGTTYTGRTNTHAAEIPFSGCPDMGNVHCEDGYDGNDFNTPNNPASGLSPTATLNDFIRKQ